MRARDEAGLKWRVARRAAWLGARQTHCVLAGPQFEGGLRLAPHEMQQEPLLFKGLGIKELHCLQFAVNALQALLL